MMSASPIRSSSCSTHCALVKADSARADSLADSVRVFQGQGLKLFGLETFRRSLHPLPADPDRARWTRTTGWAPGDLLVLILTGDVEQAYTLDVNREGFIVIPQVGQVYVANLTLGQLEDLLYARLGRVYSGVRRGAASHDQVPGLASASCATSRSSWWAMWCGRAPIRCRRGHRAHRAVRRRGPHVPTAACARSRCAAGETSWWIRSTSTTTCCTASTGATSGCRVATSSSSRCTAASSRWPARSPGPAVYELRPGETLRDLIEFAGGFGPAAYQARVRIHRILPAEYAGCRAAQRGWWWMWAPTSSPAACVPGRADGPGRLGHGAGGADRVRGYVTVKGNVWVEGQVGFTPGMKLSDAHRRSPAGPSPMSISIGF